MKVSDRPFTKTGRLDKRLWYYPHLKKLKLVSIKQLSKRCIGNEKFLNLTIEGLPAVKLESLNYSICWELERRKLLPEIELTKLMPLSAHTKLLSQRTRNLCNKHGIKTMADVLARCVDEEDKGFQPIREKKFTITANYQLARLLQHYRLITEETFHLVRRPYWKLLVPVWEDFEESDTKRIREFKYKWSNKAKEIICKILARKYRYNRLIHHKWEVASIKKLVLEFVRIDHRNRLVFYDKYHAGPDPHDKDFFAEHGPKAFIEIRTFLESLYYLDKPDQEELDRRFTEEE